MIKKLLVIKSEMYAEDVSRGPVSCKSPAAGAALFPLTPLKSA
jgi:hypothetical protein